jgi:hypothetical protein
MANRAYIVLRRNDLDDNFLQALDLIPNSSQGNPSRTYEPNGQTHYISHFLLDGVNTGVVLDAGPPVLFDGDAYGLSAYLADRIENSGTVNDPPLTQAHARGIAARIEALASDGDSLTETDIDAAINAEAGVTGAGLAVGNSTGSVEDILRILSGERYKVPDGETISDGTPTYIAVDPGVTRDGGYFVTRPSVLQPLSNPGGRNPFTTPALLQAAPVQTGTQDENFVDLLHVYNTGDLHRSALLGALSEMKATTFTFINSNFTYGTGGTALALDNATEIPESGQAPAVVVYAADGTVI